MNIVDTKTLAEMSDADFDKICDAIEAEIVRLENINYASPGARALSDFASAIVANRYAKQIEKDTPKGVGMYYTPASIVVTSMTTGTGAFLKQATDEVVKNGTVNPPYDVK